MQVFTKRLLSPFTKRLHPGAKRSIWLSIKFGFRPLIISAGMHRSASTLLYNILRLCLHAKYGDNLTAGWIEDIDGLSRKKMNLIKTHNINRILAHRANHIFYTYRDIRQALVSASIKFDMPPSIIRCRRWVNQYQRAKKYADFMLSYENIVHNTERQIVRIADILKVEVKPKIIINYLPKVMADRGRSKNFNKLTQMHGNHSSGSDPNEWKTALDNQLKQQIETEFAWWFKETGYN